MDAASLPVVVIGGGPVGLAAAAHLRERALPVLVLESGAEPAAAVQTWGHVQLFSPWSYLIDGAARRLLEADGWTAPDPDVHPSGEEWRTAYLLPLAEALGAVVRTGMRVESVSRQGHDLLMDDRRGEVPYVITLTGPGGQERLLAAAVIDASGTVGTPSPLGADGTPALGEAPARAAGVISSTIPTSREIAELAGHHIVVAGAGHSAMTALIALADLVRGEPSTQVTWALRRPLTPVRLGGGTDDTLERRGALGAATVRAVDEGLISVVAPFRVESIQKALTGHVLVAADASRIEAVDRVLSLTGYRPDLTLAAEVRVDMDPSLQAPRRLAPLIDPNIHSCGTVPPHGVAELRHPDDGYYVVGMKSYGRAPTFLALTGYEQVRSIVATIAGDHAAAAAVELVLPATGVCSGPGLRADAAPDGLVLAGEGSGCC